MTTTDMHEFRVPIPARPPRSVDEYMTALARLPTPGPTPVGRRTLVVRARLAALRELRRRRAALAGLPALLMEVVTYIVVARVSAAWVLTRASRAWHEFPMDPTLASVLLPCVAVALCFAVIRPRVT